MRPYGRRGEELVVVLDDGRELRVPLLAGAGLRPGTGLNGDALRRIEAEAQRHDVREAALRLLSHRDRSRIELRRRLLRRDVDATVVDSVLDDLERQRLVDDDRFAESFVRDRVRAKPRGRRRLSAELRQRGVDQDVAGHAIDRTFSDEETGELTLAVEAARRWARRASDAERAALCGGEREARERARRRFWGFMSRRGFAPDAIRAGMDAVCS